SSRILLLYFIVASIYILATFAEIYVIRPFLSNYYDEVNSLTSVLSSIFAIIGLPFIALLVIVISFVILLTILSTLLYFFDLIIKCFASFIGSKHLGRWVKLSSFILLLFGFILDLLSSYRSSGNLLENPAVPPPGGGPTDYRTLSDDL